jgi:hypothetical protein
MKNTIIFLLGFFVAISIAATTTDLVTFKPASPKSTVSYFGRMPSAFTQKYAKMGYQVKSSAGSGYGDVYVVMVKY